MTCATSPPTETVYTLLAGSPVVIVTPAGLPILLGTYEAIRSTITGPGGVGNTTGPLSAGAVEGALSTGVTVGPPATGAVEGPKEAC